MLSKCNLLSGMAHRLQLGVDLDVHLRKELWVTSLLTL